jgi:hypothetical protein
MRSFSRSAAVGAGLGAAMIRMGFGMLAALASVAGMPLAQQPAAPAPPAHNTFVLAGCLEAPLPGTSTFRLTSAVPVGQAPPSRPTSAANATATTGSKPAYLLQPVSGVNQSGLGVDALKPHLARRVEATLRPIDTVAPAPSRTGATSQETTAPVDPAPERFSVTVITPIGGSCP